jgi:hypothetical protein
VVSLFLIKKLLAHILRVGQVVGLMSKTARERCIRDTVFEKETLPFDLASCQMFSGL